MKEPTSNPVNIEELFHRALDLEVQAREEFLAEACRGNPAALAEVRDLLNADAHADPSWEKTAFDNAMGAPEMLGPYKILEVVSSGGMGTVYRAVRADDEFEQRVAIKLIRAGMDSQIIIRRFRQERQILASLEHPNIARLLDGGTTPTGVPYLVMEFIEGRPITEFADAMKLTTVERLGLFLRVCSAVEYAHQKLVVHRDLKPGNILVTSDGTPKLLDFGIAKLLSSDSGLEQTATAAQFFTPEYASPEQIRQEPVGTSTDIYSLGALLYRLLTGHRAYRLKSARPDELAQAICTQEPERPSVAVTRRGEPSEPRPEDVSSVREGSPAKLRRRLHGDLDNIILMALRKDPSRRYGSAGQFAEDITRYLGGRPVVAHADSFAYRARKFTRRNSLGVIAAAALSLTLVAGIVTTLWQARVAERQRQRAESRVNDMRKLSNFLLSEITETLEKVPGTLKVRQAMVQRSTEYLDKLAVDSAGDRELQGEIADGYYQIARFTFDVDRALAQLYKARVIAEQLVQAEPGNSGFVILLARIYTEIANQLELRGDLPAAISIQQLALPLFEPLHSMPRNVQAEQVNAILCLGRFYAASGQDRTALEYNDRTLAIVERARRETPDDQDFRDLLSVAYNYRVRALYEMGDYKEALEYTRRDCEVIEADVAAQPGNSVFVRRQWVCDSWRGRLLSKLGQTEAAIEQVKNGLALIERLSAKDPSDLGHKRGIATTELLLAQLYRKQGNLRAAAAELTKGINMSSALQALDPRKAETRSDLALMNQEQGIEQRTAGQFDAAAASLNRSLGFFAELVALDPKNGHLLANQADAYADCALIAESRNLGAEATVAWSRARDIYAGLRQRKMLRELDVLKLETAERNAAGGR